MRLFDHFLNEATALAYLETLVWPDGPHCHHCGETEKIGRLKGVSTPPGSFKCYGCRKRFNLRHGLIFENSHVPLHVWLRAIYLLAASNHRWGAQRLSRALGVSLRTAWHLKLRVLQPGSSVHQENMCAQEPSDDDGISGHARVHKANHQPICPDMSGNPSVTSAEQDGANGAGLHYGASIKPCGHVDIRLKMFLDASALLPDTDAQRHFEVLLREVIQIPRTSSGSAARADSETQLLLWAMPNN